MAKSNVDPQQPALQKLPYVLTKARSDSASNAWLSAHVATLNLKFRQGAVSQQAHAAKKLLTRHENHTIK